MTQWLRRLEKSLLTVAVSMAAVNSDRLLAFNLIRGVVGGSFPSQID